MTGDRRLQPHEMRVFMEHGSIGWDTLKELFFVGGEPSLFEVGFLEVFSKIEAHTNFIVEYGAKIEALMSLQSTLMLTLRRLDELDEKLEEQKQILMDDITELKKMAKEIDEHADSS